MTNSALLGDPPATSRDAMIRKGMQTFITAFNPVPSLPFGPTRPTPDLAGESNASKVKTTSATALTLVLVITVGRFWRRFKTPDWKAGPDDYFIVGASLVAVAYIAQIMAYFPSGNCYGRHMWFCTYEDLQALYLVRWLSPFSQLHSNTYRASLWDKPSSISAYTVQSFPFFTSFDVLPAAAALDSSK